MQQFTSSITVTALLLISSCTNPDKPQEDQGSNDSLVVIDSTKQTDFATEKNDAIPEETPSPFEIIALLTEGTYLEGQLPSSIDSGNWYALVGKEAGISEMVKVELTEAVYEPSEGEDYARSSYISTIPKMYDNAVILLHVNGSMKPGEIKGRKEEKFIEPDSNYELALPGFFLQGEGTASVNEQDETSYERYGLVLYQGDRVQQLYSDLSFSAKTPVLIWSGDVNKDGLPDLLIQCSVDESDTEAHYQLWLSDPAGEELVKIVAEHKIFPSA